VETYLFYPIIRVYVIATISYLLIQLALAIANWLYQKWQEPGQLALVKSLWRQGQLPRISVIFPVYNEDPDVLARTLKHAAACLEIPGLELIFVDDGSRNPNELEPLYRHYEAACCPDRLRVLRMPQNRGKRVALYHGFEIARGELIITADSDTLIYPAGVLRLVAPIIADPKIGAVTGDVQVSNWRDTWLTRLIALRYWVSFHVERGAQSFTGSMMVCSGPFAVYRAPLIHEVRQDFISQTFLGKPCTYGDDRHLTWLILEKGYLTRIQEGAVARTIAPRTIPAYVPQQVRWTKSFIRELFWCLPGFRHISLYALVDTLYQPFISFCFMFAMSNVLFLFFETFNPFLLLGEFLILLLMASIRGLYGLARTRWPHFVQFPLYGLLHVTVILPLRWKALFTLADTGWGTRNGREKSDFDQFKRWQAFFFGTALLLGVAAALLVPDSVAAGIRGLHIFDPLELAAYFANTLAYWWARGALVAIALLPIFATLGLLRLNGVAQRLPARQKRPAWAAARQPAVQRPVAGPVASQAPAAGWVSPAARWVPPIETGTYSLSFNPAWQAVETARRAMTSLNSGETLPWLVARPPTLNWNMVPALRETFQALESGTGVPA